MIVYFANRAMDILGLASTELPKGFHITNDTETADVETGILTLECTVHWTQESRALAQKCTAVGNYMLKQTTDFLMEYRLYYDSECYTIIEVEEDTKDRTTYIYAESGGMDLLNSVVGPYAATTAHTAAWYISMFTENSGFVVNRSHIEDLERKLEWTGEATVAERVASVGTQFDHAEIEYRVTMQGLQLWEKLINIHEKRGEDNHVILRLNQEVDRIVTTTSIADLATALYVTGGIPEGEEDPVTLEGYSATAAGGDIYTDGDGIVKSKSALATWTRYANAQEPYQSGDGHIVKRWSYDTTSQSELFNRAVTQLQKIYTPAVNYEVDITTIPDEVGIGDYIYIVDEEGELYVQSRVLGIQTSAANKTATLTLGDYRLATDGLSTQVDSLTTQIASVRSQTVKTAATVDSLKSDVSSLKNSTVSSSSSVSVTLSNSYGSASGTLSFSSGMSLNIQYLFTSYALLSETAQIRLDSNYGYVYGPFGFQSPLTLNIQNLLPSNLSQLNNDADYATRSEIPDVSGYATEQWVQDQGYLTEAEAGDQGYVTEEWVKEQGYLTEIPDNITCSNVYSCKTASTKGDNTEEGFFIGGDITSWSMGFIWSNDTGNTYGGIGLFYPELANGSGGISGNNLFCYADISKTQGVYFGFPSTSGWHGNATHIQGNYIQIASADSDYAGRIIIGQSESTRIEVNGTTDWDSDERLKTLIQPLETSRLDNLTPVSFRWKDGDDRRHYGYIAQAVQPHFPELVHEGTDGMLGIAYTEIIPLLHCKINEQQAKIESLEERIAKLEAIINENT